MTILVCGFEPFGGQSVNAALEVVCRLPNRISGVKIKVIEIPVVYYKSVSSVMKQVDRDPSITDVILVGESGGRSRVSLEMIAVNYDDSALPDNSGEVRRGKKIDPEGPDAYFTTIPAAQIVDEMVSQTHIPIFPSWIAGHFLCNHVIYGVIHALKEKKTNIRAGFVHVPYTFEQAAALGTPGMSAESMSSILTTIIEILIDKTTADTKKKLEYTTTN